MNKYFSYRISLIIISFTAIFLIASCSKYKTPSITIGKPTNNQEFPAGSVIEIEAEIWDPEGITSEFLTVTKVNSSNDTIVNFKDYRFYTSTYHLNNSFTGEANTIYKILVSTIGDRLVSDSILVKVN